MSAGDHRGSGALNWGIVGESPAILGVVDLIPTFGPTDHTILIVGETGTGKELVASAIHAVSGRDRIIAVNCSAIAPGLIESEIFGHVRGAFTGAERTRKGLFAKAGAGTLFLDEIGELPLTLQPKLLRALDVGEFLPVGSSGPQKLKARIIAATNRNLEQEVEEGRFRGDLYWRLHKVQIQLPPLRARASDIPLLATHLAGGISITENAMSRLQRYSWPGNVRQLENVIQVACVLAGEGPVRLEHLDVQIQSAPSAQPASASAAFRVLCPRKDAIREHTLYTFEATSRDVMKTARILEIHDSTLRRNLKEYGAWPSRGGGSGPESEG
jgi:DNA-binding NtrC family response regulator